MELSDEEEGLNKWNQKGKSYRREEDECLQREREDGGLYGGADDCEKEDIGG